MVNMKIIEEFMIKKNMTKNELAKMIGISRKTLDKRFNCKILLEAECNALIKIFDIKNPSQIFFATSYVESNKIEGVGSLETRRIFFGDCSDL